MSQAFQYVFVYKPYNMVCSRGSNRSHPTLNSLGLPPDLHSVGRLDHDSEGLLLMTNDGDLLHRLTHPHFHHPKTYLALVIGDVTPDALQQLRDGVEIKLGATKPSDVEVLLSPPPLPPFNTPGPLPSPDKTTWLRIVLYEGMNRQIRRMTAVVNLSTLRLVRVALGPLTLPHDLMPGQWRALTLVERKVLWDWVWPQGRSDSQGMASSSALGTANS
jgi:23S rRNA pseudouridine2457 synthase